MTRHLLTDDTMTEELPMIRDDIPMREDVARPSAEAMVEQLSAQAMKFRAMCQEEMERLEGAIAELRAQRTFWSEQHDIMTHFLVRDQLSGAVSGPMDRDMPMASRMRREMEN